MGQAGPLSPPATMNATPSLFDLAPLLAAGFLDVDATHLRATPAGQQRLNALLERLVA